MAMVLAGEIGTFPFGFEPLGWAYCNGQTLSIEEYGDLFAILGTTYGGDGRTNFALPDLNGRVMVSFGSGPGSINLAMAQKAGLDSVALDLTTMPEHEHVMFGGVVTPENPSQHSWQPTTGAMFSTSAPKPVYEQSVVGGGYPLHVDMIGPVGGSAPHANAQPFLTLNFCIALHDMD
jgi:microcystin-dependent protein